MSEIDLIEAAEVLLPCQDIGESLDFFVDQLGFQMKLIFPADGPREAVLEGYGLRLRLSRAHSGINPGHLRLMSMEPTKIAGGKQRLRAPNGTLIDIVDADPPQVIPEPPAELVIQRLAGEASWGTGRAGMQYRDLIPGRLNGSFIGSHIRILNGGPVPDYVHFHKIRFQMIFCYKGWVKVAYEAQSETMTMRPGDCFLQPPGIRHQVLECSDGMEVIEITCPAEHDTIPDPVMVLPAAETIADQEYHGQKFVFHEAAKTDWQSWRLPGFEARDIGIGAATGGLAGARVARRVGNHDERARCHLGEFAFMFVLHGHVTLNTDGGPNILRAGDCASVPPGLPHSLQDASKDLEILDVTLPADLPVELAEQNS